MKKCLVLFLVLMMTGVHAFAMTFTDANGREVNLDAPSRVVSLYNSYGAAWLSAGGNLVGSIADGFDGGRMDEGVQNLGSHISPNMEMLFSLSPDFVLLSADVASHREIGSVLDAAHIPCAFFSAQDYKNYMEMMDLFCGITGREDLYQKQVEAVCQPIEEMIAEARNLSANPTALLIRANSTAVKCRSSEGTVAGNILRDMGFMNLADGNSGLCENVSMENVLIEDPDYIFVILQGTNREAAEGNLASALTGNPAWNTLTAVREGRFYILDRSLFHYHPNERWPEAYGFILDILKGEA